MLKDLFRNRLFIGALAFFVLCVGGSLLYMQHVEQQSARESAVHEERLKQFTERETRQPTKGVSSVAAQTEPVGHFHEDGTFHAEPHDAPVEVSESEVFPPVLAAPVVAQQANTQIDAATLESAERRLKDPDVSNAWVEWSKKNKELSEEFFQAAREDTALLPTTEEELERFNNDPEWQRRRNEALHKTAEIHTRLKAHEKENPLLQ